MLSRGLMSIFILWSANFPRTGGEASAEQSRTIPSSAWLEMLGLMPSSTGMSLLAIRALVTHIQLAIDQELFLQLSSIPFPSLSTQPGSPCARCRIWPFPLLSFAHSVKAQFSLQGLPFLQESQLLLPVLHHL